MEDLTGRLAVVTGGASGIGLAMAQRFAAEGMRILIGDIEPPALEAAVAALAASGAEASGLVTDVGDGTSVQALADAAAALGGAHVVCLNAGVGTGGLSWELPVETWEWVLRVNLWGVVHGVRSFVPQLIAQDAGHLVATASIAGLVAAPFMGPYNASKHGVVAIAETVHHELAMSAPHVKVSVVCPGWVRTRIAESERNRPTDLAVEGDGGAGTAAVLQSLLDSGMEPTVVADKVLDAIRAERFWVLTHDDEADFWVDAVQRRLRSIGERTNPVLGFPPV